MSQPADDAGGPQQPPSLKETLVEAHERAQDAMSLSGRRIRNGIAAGDLGRVEAAAADLVVSLVQVSEVVSSRLVAGKADGLPTSLFGSCAEARGGGGGTVPRSASAEALTSAFASLGRLPAAADAAGEAPPAAQPGFSSPARGEPGGAASPTAEAALPEAAASPLRAGLAGGLRSLQQVPERVNEAITKLIAADDLSSNAEQVMRRRRVRTTQPASSSPRKEDAGSPGASPGARSPASPSGLRSGS